MNKRSQPTNRCFQKWTAIFAMAVAVLAGGIASHAASPVGGAAVRQRMAARQRAYQASAEKLEIGRIEIAPRSVPVFGRMEVQFALSGTFANPFDPAQIQVDGIVTRPDGRAIAVPAFFCAPYEPTRGLTQLTSNVAYRATGSPGWRLRFAPDAAGTYQLVIRARDAKGREAESAPQSFRAEPSARKGFVRVAAGNPMFFENSADGSLFWPVGANVAYTRSDEQRKGAKGVPSYEHYFGRAKGRMNATRVWLCHWSWLEWTPQQTANIWSEYGGAGYYNQMVAAALDRVFALAEAQGLRVMLVTEDNNEFSKTESPSGGWAAHPYNVANGGPCREPEEFFSSAEARRLYHNRLRYIAARWGYSDSLWALNSCNDYSNPGPEQLTWLRDIHQYVHELFEGYRPIIYGTNFRFEANQISDYRQAQGPVVPDKPNVVQECYYSREPDAFRPELHEQLWNGLGRGLAGIMVWSHVLVDRTDAWDEFLPLMRFVQNMPLHRAAWRPLHAVVVAAHTDVAGPYDRAVVLRGYGDVPDWGAKPPRAHFTVGLDQSRQWLEGYSHTLFGSGAKYKDWRNPPTFSMNLPAAGKFLVELSEFSGRVSTLLVSHRRSDDERWEEAATVRLENGRRLVTAGEKWVQVALPAGPQQVALDARGDWIRSERVAVIYPVSGAAGLVDASGWTDGRHAFLVLQNQSQSRLLNEVRGQQLIPLRDLEIQVAGLAEGPYRIETCETRTGIAVTTSRGSSENGQIKLRIPVLEGDAAIRISPGEP